jgi:hypothetical protein
VNAGGVKAEVDTVLKSGKVSTLQQLYDVVTGKLQQETDTYRAGGYQRTVYDTQGTQPWSRWVAQVGANGSVSHQTYWDQGRPYIETDQVFSAGATHRAAKSTSTRRG